MRKEIEDTGILRTAFTALMIILSITAFLLSINALTVYAYQVNESTTFDFGTIDISIDSFVVLVGLIVLCVIIYLKLRFRR